MSTPNHAQTAEQLETCATHPMGRAMRLLGDVCTLMIISTLLRGTKRFGELLEAIGNVSPKTVSQRLKMLGPSSMSLPLFILLEASLSSTIRTFLLPPAAASSEPSWT